MIETALYGVALGLGIYAVTALLLGTKNANRLPGGAIGGAILLSPLYISIPAALLGYLIAVGVVKLVKN